MHPGDPSHLLGKVIDGRYEILQCIGEGGMGVVYKARQTSIDRIVAIKMLSSNLAKDRSWVQRFYNEAKACSRLHHPNTIRMFDFGQTRDGQLFMAMEYLDGLSLRQVIGEQAPMDPERVLKIVLGCCASLSEAHNLGIIHRDIKADNVFLIDLPGSRDHVKLLDFGVAKLMMAEDFATQVGVVFGTPQYMSPEQGRGEPLTPRSDLYGVGILAYEMLTGSVPFTDQVPMNVLQMHLQSPVPPLPPRVPGTVQRVVMGALEKDPSRRYPTAAAMMEQAQSVLTAFQTGPFARLAPPPPPIGSGSAPIVPVAGNGPPGPMNGSMPGPSSERSAESPIRERPEEPRWGPSSERSAESPIRERPEEPRWGPSSERSAESPIRERPEEPRWGPRNGGRGGPHGPAHGPNGPRGADPIGSSSGPAVGPGGYGGPALPGGPAMQAGANMPTVLDRPNPILAARQGQSASAASVAAAGARTMMVSAPGESTQPAVPPVGGADMSGPGLGPMPAGEPGGPASLRPYPPGGSPEVRTMMIANTEGVVSMSREGPLARPPDSRGGPMVAYPPARAGASALFWILCLVTGLAVGIGAYWLVLELGK